MSGTLCDTVDYGPPGSCPWNSPGRILKWVACPPPGDLPQPGIKPVSLASPALAGGFFTTGSTCEAPRSYCLGPIWIKILHCHHWKGLSNHLLSEMRIRKYKHVIQGHHTDRLEASSLASSPALRCPEHCRFHTCLHVFMLAPSRQEC